MRKDRGHSGPDVVAANGGGLAPNWTPLTSVIALSGPRARMPTFSLIAEARGRLLELEISPLTDEANKISAAAIEILKITRNRVTGPNRGHGTQC